MQRFSKLTLSISAALCIDPESTSDRAVLTAPDRHNPKILRVRLDDCQLATESGTTLERAVPNISRVRAEIIAVLLESTQV